MYTTANINDDTLGSLCSYLNVIFPNLGSITAQILNLGVIVMIAKGTRLPPRAPV